ncbi:MAG: hypothetical protein ACLGJD_10910 [Gammaproteobacteria bacterium]|uniref:hypothetical protein n=1 Tax=uncultured Pseudacidovorax sp. TaxID=679313 RepID=UPI0025FBD770|nr:hypothetical protein [uncultured Pseudacidovorax sp.]
MSNVEFITELMTFSRAGPLTQVFVIDALLKQARLVAATPAERFERPMFSGAAWVAAAQEVLDRLEKVYGVARAAEPTQLRSLFAALLDADEIVVDGYETDKVVLTPSLRDPQPFLTTASGSIVEMNDQQLLLTHGEDASTGRFIDIRGEQHSLVLHRLVRTPLRPIDA